LSNRASATEALRDRLTFKRALDHAATALFRNGKRRQFTDTRLDVFRIANCLHRSALDQFPIGIRAVDRVVGHHRLGHAHGASLLSNLHCAPGHQSDASSGGGELCSSQFDRHNRGPCSLCWVGPDNPDLHQIQCSNDQRSLGRTMRLTTFSDPQGA